MRTFNLSNYFGTTIKQTFGRPWYLFWKMVQLSYPVYRSLCWKHNRYLVLVNNAVAHLKQVSTSFGRHERLLQQLWIPTYDCYLPCWISEKKTKKKKRYTLHTISTYVCEIKNTKTIKRTTNILWNWLAQTRTRIL